MLELLITLIIISILITIAVPSYQYILINTRRIDGKIGLLQLAAQLESNKQPVIKYSPENYYELKILEQNKKTNYYLLAAYPVKSQQMDKRCNILAYDALGQKGILVGNKLLISQFCWR